MTKLHSHLKKGLISILSLSLIFSSINVYAIDDTSNIIIEEDNLEEDTLLQNDEYNDSDSSYNDNSIINENMDEVDASEGETFNEGEIINQGIEENDSYNVENDDMVATYSSDTTSIDSNGVKMTTRNVTPEYHNSSTLVTVEDIIGRYQFNYTGAGVYFDENNCKTNTGFSHVPLCSSYEEKVGNYEGNSSGGYLDSSYNEGGEIYKAYLVVTMASLESYKTVVENHDITLLYAGEQNNSIKAGFKSKLEVAYSSNRCEAVGWTDVTNFVKENGYGWYYGVNIPFIKMNGDDFSSWKLVVIEKNPNVDIRKMVLNLGFNYLDGQRSVVMEASGTNITSKKNDIVTGQLLFSATNTDPTNNSGNQMYYSMDGSNFKKITTKNGLRTEATPLMMVMSRNGNPIKNYVNWTTHYYYTYAFNSSNNAIYSTTDSSYPEATGDDIELLDITKYSDNHNVVFENNKPAVYLKMGTTSWSIVTNILGICFDIDVPTFEGNQSTKINNSSSVTITGKTINTTKVDGVTASNGKLTVYLDKGLDAKSATATIHYSNGKTSTITGIIDNTNHTVIFKDVAIYNKDDYVTYEIECTPNKNAGSEFRCSDAFSSSFMNEEVPDLKMDLDTAGASTSTTIPLYTQTINVRYENADGTFTNYETVSSGDKEYGTNMSWSRTKDLTYQAASINYKVTENHTENVTIYRNKYVLTVKPNSGKWGDSTSANKTYTLRVGQTQSIPSITRDYHTFKGWTLSGNGSSLKDSTFIMGTTNASLIANWNINQYNVTYIDVVDSTSGKQLGKTTKKVNYNSNVRGSDIGSNTSDNAYYNGYYYSSDTSATVTTSGAIVYRIFKLRTIDKTSNLTWNDNNNKNGFRPSKYTLKLLRNGSVFKQVELTSSQTSYTFSNLNKYDSNGKAYTYTFQVDTNSDRYKTSINGNNIVENYQNSTFSVTIPKTISLDGKTGSSDYNIKVNGTFYYNDTLTIIPNTSFTLKDKNGVNTINANVTQNVTTFTKNNLGTISGNINLSKNKFAGSYTGTFNFAIKFTRKD